MPLSLTAFLISPVLMTLTTFAIDATNPAVFKVKMLTSASPSCSKAANVTSALYFKVVDLKPRLGKRRCKGI